MPGKKKPQGPISWTTLGSAPYPTADEPCSGYLLQAGGANVLVDIGGGVLGALQQLSSGSKTCTPSGSATSTPITSATCRSSTTPSRSPSSRLRKIPVLGPAGWAARVEAFVKSAVDHQMSNFFQVVELKDRGIAEIGDLRIQARAVEHGVPAFGLTARYGDRRLAYTGDSGPCDNLVTLAKGARVLVAECVRDRDRDPVGPPLPRGRRPRPRPTPASRAWC